MMSTRQTQQWRHQAAAAGSWGKTCPVNRWYKAGVCRPRFFSFCAVAARSQTQRHPQRV